MHRGLFMSQVEKDTRRAKLYNVITTHTSQTWAMTLVKFLLSVVDAQGVARQTPVLPTTNCLSAIPEQPSVSSCPTMT
jgi:trehalose 6-phosphate synthase/phosphatase